MNSILISIRPKWCELIASDKKTIEVRKTKPRSEAPFKCYIYCTKDKVGDGVHYYEHEDGVYHLNGKDYKAFLSGTVIGEFVCDEVIDLHDNGESIVAITDYDLDGCCLTYEEIHNYGGKYGWHISDLVIYDTPKKLNDFYKCGFEDDYSEWEDLHTIGVSGVGRVEYPKEPKLDDYVIKRPPQSWCYVEEYKGDVA